MSPAVRAYEDEIVNGALASCLAKSKEIGGIVEQHVSHSFHPAISSALPPSMAHTPIDLRRDGANSRPPSSNLYAELNSITSN